VRQAVIQLAVRFVAQAAGRRPPPFEFAGSGRFALPWRAEIPVACGLVDHSFFGAGHAGLSGIVIVARTASAVPRTEEVLEMAFNTQRHPIYVGRAAASVKAWLIGSAVAEARLAAQRTGRDTKQQPQRPGAYGLLVGLSRG
jgi:hypothetical protein